MTREIALLDFCPTSVQNPTKKAGSHDPSLLVSLSENLKPLKQLQPHLADVLLANGIKDAAKSISRCNAPSSQCRNRLCIVCRALQATNKRRCLKEHLLSTFQVNPKAFLWSVTPEMLDTAVRHHEKALGLVSGVRALTRSLAVVNWFASTEIELSKLGDSSLNIHAHTLMVIKPPKAGRRYIRQEDWPELMEQAWQTACAHATDCHPKHLVTPTDAFSWASYVTKPANFVNYAATVRELLRAPEQFLEQAEALHRVPRYFGPMASRRKPSTIQRINQQ